VHLYSGLNKSGQGEATPYWFKVNPLYFRRIRYGDWKMELKRRDFLKMTAALAAAGVSPSLLAAGEEAFTN